ncbi:hypothetical protein QD460_17865 [Rhizobium jaguaris]|uniref:FUSC family protein n=1 Tax=Rhizobium jaguaris TaxID=1312183 RepID=A0A387FNA9_9HYPH|nr:hypothetical protein [Rhizobium jaguaris]AYG60288.1 hypothetical protein CCGE525_16795 [Rhizobium jaguaris]
MLRILTITFRWRWAVSIVAAGTGFGAAFGWEKHGLVAAIALGFVGLAASAPFAYSPAAFFELLGQFLGELLMNLI